MCLSKVEESYDIPCTLIVDGWKQFGGTETAPQFSAFMWKGKRAVPLDKWITATDENAKSVRADDRTDYEPGFHVWAEEPKKKAGYTRVFVRRITTMGAQDGQKCVIAREMYVPSDPNGWPPKEKDLMDRIKDVVAGEA